MQKFIISMFLFAGLLLQITMPCSLFAENWWDSPDTSVKTDAINVENQTVGNHQVVKHASRANWEKGYIEVMAGATADTSKTVNLGHAYSVALKTARHLAYEKLAETVSGLNLYSDATYDRELMVDSNLRTVLKAMIRNAQVVKEDQKQFSDGSIWAEVTLGLKMFTPNGLIQPSVEWARQNPAKVTAPADQLPAANEPAHENEDTQNSVVSSPAPSSPETGVYTGLILDAGQKGGNPAMLPKILDEKGTILYGTGKIDKNYIIQYGLMGYKKAILAAKQSDRTGPNPLIVPVLRISGKNMTDFIVSEADGQKIRQAVKAKDFLKECRVIAVLN